MFSSSHLAGVFVCRSVARSRVASSTARRPPPARSLSTATSKLDSRRSFALLNRIATRPAQVMHEQQLSRCVALCWRWSSRKKPNTRALAARQRDCMCSPKRPGALASLTSPTGRSRETRSGLRTPGRFARYLITTMLGSVRDKQRRELLSRLLLAPLCSRRPTDGNVGQRPLTPDGVTSSQLPLAP